jgi:hypothetical protein
MFVVTLCPQNNATKVISVEISCVVCNAIGVYVGDCGHGQ